MKYDYKIIDIELDVIESTPCVRATVKTEAGTAEILEWLNMNFEEGGYNLEETDSATNCGHNDDAIDEIFPMAESRFGWGKDRCDETPESIWLPDQHSHEAALMRMRNEIEEWVGKQGLL